MKREKRVINLGEDFEYKKNIFDGYFCQYKELYECYDRCSWEKHRIYDKYKNMLYEHCDRVICYGVRSFSHFIITLHARIEKDGKMYYVLITPSHNYICEISESDRDLQY